MLTSSMLSLLTLLQWPILLNGVCYDVGDHRNLPCNITLAFSTTTLSINTNQDGKFTIQIPDSAHHIIFESVGYEKRIIGLNRIGHGYEDYTFPIHVPLLKTGMDPSIKEDEALFPKSQVFFNVDAPDSLDITILFTKNSNREILEPRSIVSTAKNRILAVDYMLPGEYDLQIGILDRKGISNTFLQKKTIVKTGFNFLSVQYTNNQTLSSVDFIKSRTLYFDQSSYNLRKDSRMVLDSICSILVRKHNLIASITGHTDNVGRANLNFILSEYRARVVHTYMTNHGVPPGQIQISWKGSSAPVAMNDSEENKSKNRRVEIQAAAKAAL